MPHELDAWFEHAVNCCAFLAWRLSTQGASIHFRSNGYEFRQPEDGDIYTILKYLALVYPQRVDAPEGPLNDASYQNCLHAHAPRVPRCRLDAGAPAWVLMCCPLLLAAQTQNPPKDEPPKPEPVKTSITVVEKISAETPANVTVLDSTALQESPGTNLDDRLRDVPGFSLFRRSSSMVANPTTQGISLRGIGSSGASRTLVLWDGIPANDPFGGWVYWTQFVPGEIGSAEISRGAATSVFGDRAMSGAIGLFTRPAEKLHVLAEYEFGNDSTHDISAGFADVWSRMAISGSARAFTHRWLLHRARLHSRRRGHARQRAVRHRRCAHRSVHIDRQFLLQDRACSPKSARTAPRSLTIPPGWAPSRLRYAREFTNDSFSVLGFHTRSGFHATFDSVTNNRNTDRLTYSQTVPSDAVGGAFLWQHHERKWNLMAGADVDRLGGTSTDHVIPTGQRVGGGTQLQHGIFGQADVSLGPVKLFAGVRHSFRR